MDGREVFNAHASAREDEKLARFLSIPGAQVSPLNKRLDDFGTMGVGCNKLIALLAANHNPNLKAEGQSEKFAGQVQKKVGQIEKVFET